MGLLDIGSIVKSVGNIADDLFTSDEERLKIALKEKEMDAALIQGQLTVNAQEAQHGSIFVAGWRPFIGWVGGIALAYQFVLYPFLIWIWALGQAQGWLPCYIDPAHHRRLYLYYATGIRQWAIICHYYGHVRHWRYAIL